MPSPRTPCAAARSGMHAAAHRLSRRTGVRRCLRFGTNRSAQEVHGGPGRLSMWTMMCDGADIIALDGFFPSPVVSVLDTCYLRGA
jgi:hypothetical protein